MNLKVGIAGFLLLLPACTACEKKQLALSDSGYTFTEVFECDNGACVNPYMDSGDPWQIGRKITLFSGDSFCSGTVSDKKLEDEHFEGLRISTSCTGPFESYALLDTTPTTYRKIAITDTSNSNRSAALAVELDRRVDKKEFLISVNKRYSGSNVASPCQFDKMNVQSINIPLHSVSVVHYEQNCGTPAYIQIDEKLEALTLDCFSGIGAFNLNGTDILKFRETICGTDASRVKFLELKLVKSQNRK